MKSLQILNIIKATQVLKFDNRKLKRVGLIVLALQLAALGITSNAHNAEAYTVQNILGVNDPVGKSFSTSTNGRYVAFMGYMSYSSLDTNANIDPYVLDTQTGTYTLLSTTPSGTYTTRNNGQISDIVILSGNGKFALFNSGSSDLAATAGANVQQNVYLRDLQTGITYLAAKGDSGNAIDQFPVGLSEDGRFVYYSSQGGSGSQPLYQWDRTLDTRQRVDADNSGNPSTGGVVNIGTYGHKEVSCDGRYVVFASGASDLVSGDTNGKVDIFLADQMAGHTIKNITIASDSTSMSPTVSCDGNYVLFWSSASNLVSGDTNNAPDLFRYKVSDGTTDRVAVNNDGSQYPGDSTGKFNNTGYDMSMDGRFIFYSFTSGSSTTIAMRDTLLGTTTTPFTGQSPVNIFATYSGSKLYYINFDGYNYRLKTVTGYLPN